MKNCLSEKILLLLHDGEGSVAERTHLESCLSCARRYRLLADDIKEVVTILKQPPPASAAPGRRMYAWMRWSLAAAVVAVAFLLGRMTTAGVLGGSSFHARATSRTRVASAGGSTAGANGIAPTYALYIDNLIGSQDEADPGQLGVADAWETDSDSDGL
ncbi:MAG: hypothetical protein JO121_12660 [Deltaproteobacteria bacterium]|nr:hypothetical protein [Deltaproteobacteria bacterium]